MEEIDIRKLVAMAFLVPWILAAVEGHEAPLVFKDCYGKCYSKCNVTRPLWCASLCVGKCKHSKSIPDHLCYCTYSCSKFMCTNVGSDPDKLQGCVMNCSKLCNKTNY